jgi:hypothetical protein
VVYSVHSHSAERGTSWPMPPHSQKRCTDSEIALNEKQDAQPPCSAKSRCNAVSVRSQAMLRRGMIVPDYDCSICLTRSVGSVSRLVQPARLGCVATTTVSHSRFCMRDFASPVGVLDELLNESGCVQLTRNPVASLLHEAQDDPDTCSLDHGLMEISALLGPPR